MSPATASHPSTTAASPEALLHATERRLTVDQYFAMGDAGILGDEDRVELLDGRLIDMPPIGPPHSHSVNGIEQLFARRLYRDKETLAQISVQNPIQIDDHSAPQPDLVLYDPDMPRDRHPQPDDIDLVVEVADTSVAYDRDVKAGRYAAAGLREYWLVDLPGAAVDVYRRPEADGYAERIRHRAGDTLTVDALPAMDAVPVEDIV